MVGLIVVDVGSTLGEFTGPKTAEVLAPYALLDIPRINEESRRFLHCAPKLTDEVKERMCHAIVMDPANWPDPWPDGGFDPYPYTLDVLAQLSQIAPVVALSNVPVTAENDRMPTVTEKCGAYLREVATSYTMGMRKPDRTLWHTLCDRHGVAPEDVVHIGDDWMADVLGAVSAGCRAVFVDTRGCGTPSPTQWPCGPGNITVGADLRDGLTATRQWHEQDLLSRRPDATDHQLGGGGKALLPAERA